MSFGAFLENRRICKKLSISSLAGEAKVSTAAISRLESGDLQPSKDIALRLANALKEPQDEWLMAAGFLSSELTTLAASNPAEIIRHIRDVAGMSPINRVLAELEPAVSNAEHRIRAGLLDYTEKTSLDAWRSLNPQRSERSLAADAALMALCEEIAGDRKEVDHLKGLRAMFNLPHWVVDAAIEACRTSPSMLGSLYEALASRQDRYAQGQYFTPDNISGFMARLVRDAGAPVVLDPAVGAGALVSQLPSSTSVVGFDISPVCVAMATAGLLARGFTDVQLRCQDFLEAGDLFSSKRATMPVADAIVCNPPYMRHHLIPPRIKRQLAEVYSARFGVRLSTLSTNYVYFFLEALTRLREGGLLVFITPADFLDTKFGEGLKSVLIKHTTIEETLLFNREISAFAGVLTTSTITVARKTPPERNHAIRFSEVSCDDNKVLRLEPNLRQATSIKAAERWSSFFGERESELSRLTKDRPCILSDYLRIRRGIATGSNGFFVVSQAIVEEWGIEQEYLQAVVASARDLPDCELTCDDWAKLRDRGRPCWFLAVSDSLEALVGKNVLRYIRHGEEIGVNQRFNCRTRSPWYKPERVDPPDVIVTYMNRGKTRFVKNTAGCRVMSVFLNGFLTPRCENVESLLEILNSTETNELITKLGRTYGGGLGKIEPSELSSLPMPRLS